MPNDSSAYKQAAMKEYRVRLNDLIYKTVNDHSRANLNQDIDNTIGSGGGSLER